MTQIVGLIGKSIKQIRELKHLSQMGICADAVVLQGHFSFFENGKVEPSISRLGKLATVGEVSIREFFKNGKWD